MNKLFYKKCFAATIGTILLYAYPVFAEIPGKYLTANLQGSDLLDLFLSHPVFFWTVLMVLVLALIAYGVYQLLRKNPN